MQIQKGLVKYKDRTDIVCTYGLTDDGKQYYFLDDNSIPNGNIIASTVLVEAIDPVVTASSVGVIDANGNVVIPFENKSIKSIAPGLLLVEKANSTTPSVVEAVKLRSDPLAATKLVTTPATIKDNMNAKMGNGGRFVFNDQFSEATVCDMNGNNLINNEYYSFIGIKNNEALYFSKNTVDSPVTEFSLTSGGIVEASMPNSEVAPLDVEGTDVTQATIDGAMSEKEVNDNKFGNGDITAADFEEMAVAEDESQVMVDNTIPPESLSADKIVETPVDVPSEDAVKDREATTPDLEAPVYNGFSPADVVSDMASAHVDVPALPTDPEKSEEVAVAVADVPSEVAVENNEEVPAAEEKVPEEQAIVPVTEPVSESVVEVAEEQAEEKEEVEPVSLSEDVIELPISTPRVDTPAEDSVDVAPVAAEVPEEKTSKDNDLMTFDFGDNINYSNEDDSDLIFNNAIQDSKNVDDTVNDFKSDLFDIDLESDIFEGSMLHADKIVQDSYGDVGVSSGVKDNIIEDVASTMANLISLNKTQKEKIAAYEDKIQQITVNHKKVVEKARSQVRDLEVSKAKLKNYETIVSKLESKIQLLESKVKDQDKVISSQSNELESLRPQIEGKRELARILADAQSLLDQE